MKQVVQRLVEVFLGNHPQASAEDVADWLWLAARTAPTVQARPLGKPVTPSPPEPPVGSPFEPEQRPAPPTPPSPASAERRKPEPKRRPDDGQREWQMGIGTDSAQGSAGQPLHIAGGRALPHPRAIARALRPLVRRVSAPDLPPSLDEAASVESTMETHGRLWMPVLVPPSRPWLDLALVIDDSRSMRIWHRTLKEWVEVLRRQGAFRDLRVWRLRGTVDQGPRLYLERGRDRRHYRELINPARTRLILLATDCVSPLWQDPELLRWLGEWGRRHPLHLVQMLPQRLWSQSRLRDAGLAAVTATAPAPCNTQLRVERTLPSRLHAPTDETLPLSLTTLEPDRLSDWARFVAGHGDVQLPAFHFRPAVAIASAAPAAPGAGLSERERFDRFRNAASATAFKLATVLAATPLHPPLMRLVQQALVPEADQSHMAEFFLSGLLKRVKTAREERIGEPLDPVEIRYDFLSDALRGRLLDAGLITEAVQVQTLLSDYIAQRTGGGFDFLALVTNPDALAGLRERAGIEGFAKITEAVLRRLGGRFGRSISGVRRAKAASFQWVRVPSGNFRSSRKQSEQSWR
jgi:hypothetical protein